jgi:hypothetical protein
MYAGLGGADVLITGSLRTTAGDAGRMLRG